MPCGEAGVQEKIEAPHVGKCVRRGLVKRINKELNGRVIGNVIQDDGDDCKGAVCVRVGGDGAMS